MLLLIQGASEPPRSGTVSNGEAGSTGSSSDVCGPKEVAVQASKDRITGISSVIVERGVPEACAGTSENKEECSPEKRALESVSTMNSSFYSLVDTSVEDSEEEETVGFQVRPRQDTYRKESPIGQEEAVGKFWRSPIVDDTDDGSQTDGSQRGGSNKRMRESTSPQVTISKKYRPEEEKMAMGIAIIDMYKEVEMLNQIMTKCKNPTTNLKTTIKNITDLAYTLMNDTNMEQTMRKIIEQEYNVKKTVSDLIQKNKELQIQNNMLQQENIILIEQNADLRNENKQLKQINMQQNDIITQIGQTHKYEDAKSYLEGQWDAGLYLRTDIKTGMLGKAKDGTVDLAIIGPEKETKGKTALFLDTYPELYRVIGNSTYSR
ncbi:hypothetical protein ABEB36_009648 [Hypothenemus hampei]|uniref:Uncharacterized protein n=1 Tax=Hypothenemus hampei TaxID=57062 RepID=A0ABD1EHC3_HYPHA